MFRFVGLVLAGAIGVAACAPAAAQGTGVPRTLHAAYVTSLSFSPVFLAIEKGYFKGENLNVELQVMQSAADATAFLGLGQIDIAFGNISDTFFNAISRGVEVKIVSGMSYSPKDPKMLSPNPVFGAKSLWDSGAVRSVAALEGKKVALNARGGIVDFELGQSLKRIGKSIKGVDIVTMPFPDMPITLANASVAGAIMPEPIATVARERGVGVVLDPNPAPGALVTVVMFGKNLLAPTEAQAANGVLRALRRAANELQSPDAIMSPEKVAIWSKYTKIPAATVAKTTPYIFGHDLQLSVPSLMEQQDFLVETGRLSAKLPVERLIDSRFVIPLR